MLTRLAGGLRSGIALTVGFTATFTAIGLLLAAGLQAVVGVVPWAAAVIGGTLALLGLTMVLGWRPSLRLPIRRTRRRPAGMLAFGAGYAVASASCTLAVLLSVVTQALATASLAGVLAVFAAYAAGSATLLLTLALFATFASGAINRYPRRLLPHLHRITGVVLAASGAYLLGYWLPQLLGDGDPGSNALTGVASDLSQWITANQGVVVISGITLLGTSATAALVLRRRDRAGRATTPTS